MRPTTETSYFISFPVDGLKSKSIMEKGCVPECSAVVPVSETSRVRRKEPQQGRCGSIANSSSKGSGAIYSNRVPAAVAQPVAIRLPLASKISIVEFVVNSLPLAPSSKAAVIFCEPTKIPLAS